MNIGTTTLTRKGQITVPVYIREMMGLKEGDKVAFDMEEEGIVIKRKESVVMQTAGVLNTGEPPLTVQELREAAEDAIADETVARMKG